MSWLSAFHPFIDTMGILTILVVFVGIIANLRYIRHKRIFAQSRFFGIFMPKNPHLKRLIIKTFRYFATPVELEQLDLEILRHLIKMKRIVGFIVDITENGQLVDIIAKFRQEYDGWIIALKREDNITQWRQERKEFINLGFDDLMYIPLNPLALLGIAHYIEQSTKT